MLTHTKYVNVSFYLSLFLWPRPSQFPSPSGEVGDLSCVGFPWHSSAVQSPGELMYKRVSSARVHYRLNVGVVLVTATAFRHCPMFVRPQHTPLRELA